MQHIHNQTLAGERPLFNTHNAVLEHLTFGEGESALKECSDLEISHCLFEGRYPVWHNQHTRMQDCTLTRSCRAPLWYDRDIHMINCTSHAPKVLREVQGLTLDHCTFEEADELMWKCRDIKIKDCTLRKADYVFFNSDNLEITGLDLQGKYTFQYCHHIVITHSRLDTKDAFWESSDIVIKDSLVAGEYLGWHSNHLTLERCHITGTQPLCYADNLTLIDCTFGPDADLAFEYSSVQAVINSPVTSVKNPLTGRIQAQSFGQIILDENQKEPHDCIITATAGK